MSVRDNPDRNQNKTKKLMTFVVVPILILIIGLMALSQSNEKPTMLEIIKKLDIHCYNVNWFGQHGFQITYQESIIEIAEAIGEHDYDFVASEFYESQEIKDYFVISCPHIDSKLNAPAVFDSSIGMDAYSKCLQRISDLNENEEFCTEYQQ